MHRHTAAISWLFFVDLELFVTLYRGESFRKEFSHLGDVRSLIPETVHVMALTATATRLTRQLVIRILKMIHPKIVSISPNKPNIKYNVQVNMQSLEETFSPLVEEIRQKRTATARTIVFCRTYDQCARIYMFMVNRIGKEITEPIGVCQDIPKFRLVDMFTACTHPTVKDSILNSISSKDGTLRVIIATIAFGMGLDCPNIRRIIHWGPSSDVESYLQETGRAGRDGEQATASLYYTNIDIGQLEDEAMKKYCKNKTKCRRMILLQEFDFPINDTRTTSLCSCCDVCELTCTCSLCCT